MRAGRLLEDIVGKQLTYQSAQGKRPTKTTENQMKKPKPKTPKPRTPKTKAPEIKPLVDMKQYAELGSKVFLNDVVLNCLIGALAKIRPPIAQAFLSEMREAIAQIDLQQFPGERMQAQKFVEAVEKTLQQKP
jgi:vancomycin resistance protein YoaR